MRSNDIGSPLFPLNLDVYPNQVIVMQIYDSPESDLQLNDVFEFIGIFTFDPELVVKDDTDELSDLCDDVLDDMPPSKVFT